MNTAFPIIFCCLYKHKASAIYLDQMLCIDWCSLQDWYEIQLYGIFLASNGNVRFYLI